MSEILNGPAGRIARLRTLMAERGYDAVVVRDEADIYLLSKKIIGDAGYGEYYGHGLGHGVGIDIHELPVFGRKSNIVEEGAVITVEPGIYLPGVIHELPVFGRKSNIVEEGAVITVEPGIYLPGVGGVRLEDYGVVTRDGYVPFTTSTHELVVIDC